MALAEYKRRVSAETKDVSFSLDH